MFDLRFPYMGFQYRKLLDSSDENSANTDSCDGCYSPCDPLCSKLCSKFCPDRSPPLIYTPPTPDSVSSSHKTITTKLKIITFTVLAIVFLVLCSYIYYVRWSRRRSNSRRRSQPETTETHDEFLDEDHGPIVDHPIWYINTVGLQPSIINSIAVFKYKKGEGLVEGTDCSVCLNEFEEDETLRLLPKCSHAFHIPCIDTWLRSHTNCPMCRAPIVSNSGNKGPSSSSGANSEDAVESEETQVVIREDTTDAETEREIEGRTSELSISPDQEEELAVEIERSRGESSRGRVEDQIEQPMRRSFSLDALAASQICQALGNCNPEGSNGHSDNELAKGKEGSSVRIVSRRAAGNQSLLRLMCPSSIGRTLQNRPIFMKRSFSCNGKFLLPVSNDNNNKSRNTNPPVRSF